MAAWIWPAQSYQSRSLPLDAQRLVNMFTEPSPPDAKTQVPIYMCPGLSLFARMGSGPIRGMHIMSDPNPAVGEALYVVSGNQLFSVNVSGTATLLGTTSLGGNVVMADNGNQLVMVDGGTGWVYQPGGLNLTTTVTANAFQSLAAGNSNFATWSTAQTVQTVELSTSQTDAVIVLFITSENGSGTSPSVLSVADTSSLVWTQRSVNLNTSGVNSACEVWWAVSPGITSTTITVTYTASVRTGVIRAVEIDGANTSAPWDVNASLPAVENGSITANSVYPVSTTANSSVLLGLFYSSSSADESPVIADGWDAIGPLVASGVGAITNGIGLYFLASSIFDATETAWTSGFGAATVNVVDAIVAAPSNSMTLEVTGTIVSGDTIAFNMDNGTLFTTTVSGPPSGPPDATIVNLSTPFPSTITSGATAYVANNVLGQILQPAFSPAATVTYFDGYFAFDARGTDQFFLSSIDDATQYSTLDYASATADPDDVLAIINYHEQFLIFGTKTVEVWYDSGALAFPFQRYDGAFIQRGAASAYAIVKEDNTVLWLGEDGIFYRLNGYTPMRVSTFATEHAWAQYPSIQDAIAFVVTIEGHKFVFLNFPSGNATWCYDISAGIDPPLWHERESSGNPWV